MTQPINPNTDLPMSLKVEKIQYLKQVQSEQEINLLNQEIEKNKEKKQQSISENEQLEQSVIRDKEEKKDNSRDGKDNNKSSTNTKEKDQLKKMDNDKGKIIDIRV